MRATFLLLLTACVVTDPAHGPEKDPEAPAPSDPCDEGIAALLASSGEGFETIQAALDAAPAGDTVEVCDGTWSGSLLVPGIALTLAGAGTEATVLDGAAAGRVLTVAAGAELTLRDLTVTNGLVIGAEHDEQGGGGLVAEDADIRVERVAFTANEADFGGAVSLLRGTLTVEASSFTGNVTEQHGAGIKCDTCTVVTLAGSRFEANEGLAVEYYGPGIFTATDTVFAQNLGGMLVFTALETTTEVNLTRVTFTDNTVSDGGGAIAFRGWGSAAATIQDSTFERNVAEYGGGVFLLRSWGGGELDVSNSSFTANQARNKGGAIYEPDDHMDQNWTTRLVDCDFLDNTAFSGAALHIGTPGTLYVEGGQVHRNVALFGGGALEIGEETTVDVEHSDWGVDADDNLPDDMMPGQTWGADATFTCTAGTCN